MNDCNDLRTCRFWISGPILVLCSQLEQAVYIVTCIILSQKLYHRSQRAPVQCPIPILPSKGICLGLLKFVQLCYNYHKQFRTQIGDVGAPPPPPSRRCSQQPSHPRALVYYPIKPNRTKINTQLSVHID